MEEHFERFALKRRGMNTKYLCVNERNSNGMVRLQGEEVKTVED